MPVTFLGVRHHSPVCARLVADTIATLRPAHVLVEGPADMNDRIDELLLDHQLPIAVFSFYRDEERAQHSWTPLCDYSPEWIALREGRRCGAQVRFIDVPAWHPALRGRTNRYADAERRYRDVIDLLSERFAVDNVDTLWDHLFEVPATDDLEQRLVTYFDLIRDGADTEVADADRERYMAGWVRAAVADAGERPVVVVTGGFHRPALIHLSQTSDEHAPGWPDVPVPPPDAIAASYLVPYTFARLDAFDGYQSGMPSPGYYQHVWEIGPEAAAGELLRTVTQRLRKRHQPVSTADLIAARSLAGGLARLRGHRVPARVDVLDGLVAVLVNDALDLPLPWTSRGQLRAGTHPVVVEMIAALSGERSGRLHRDTPQRPLVHDVEAELARHRLDRPGPVRLDLTEPGDLTRAQTLHRLRVLGIPGFERHSGPAGGHDPVLTESWELFEAEHRLAKLIEASAYGATLLDAATAALAERISEIGADPGALGAVLFDTMLCGIGALSQRVLEQVAVSIEASTDLGALGDLLGAALGLYRHDRIFGAAGSGSLGAVVISAVDRALWLVEGLRGPSAPADPGRLSAVRAVRDALRHAAVPLGLRPDAALSVMQRLAVDGQCPPDVRGAAYGFVFSLGGQARDGMAPPVVVLRGVARPTVLGDWLAGLFALAREEVFTAAGEDPETLLTVLDELLTRMDEPDFLVALPALRQAFEYFPPRERDTIARTLLADRGLLAPAARLRRLPVPIDVIIASRELEQRVDAILAREGLI